MLCFKPNQIRKVFPVSYTCKQHCKLFLYTCKLYSKKVLKRLEYTSVKVTNSSFLVILMVSFIVHIVYFCCCNIYKPYISVYICNVKRVKLCGTGYFYISLVFCHVYRVIYGVYDLLEYTIYYSVFVTLIVFVIFRITSFFN